MAQLSDLISRVRLELGDQPSQFTYSSIADGTNTMFDLNAKYIEVTTLYVTIDGVPKTYPAQYSLDAVHGQITFTGAPSAGSVVRVEGEGYRYFLDDDICTFINTAVTQHSHNRSDAYGSQITLASISPVEEYPIAILATIEALWILATDSSFDINITAPDGVMIPRAQRFTQLTTIIQQRTDQYKQLCSALNIGLWRIEMGTLRRVSRTTNKLVPVYLAQEIDDSRRPERVYIENNLNGRSPMPTTVQNYDIALYQGDSYEVEFDFPFDTSSLTFAAQVRTYPNAPSLYASFTITTISTSTNLSKIKLSLTSSATKYMPVRAFWDLQATAATDPDYQMTFIKGQVFTTQQVTSD